MGESLADAIAGVRVVALEQAVSMPFCTQILAALGADVVKIEAPGRGDVIRGWDDAVDGLSTGFVAFNVGKRDVTVDAKSADGREILRRLVGSADVFVENFSPGVAARLGLGPEELCGADPRLIYCSLSGYGQSGPYRDVKAYDLLVQGESGILLSNGTEDDPAKVGIPITDQIAGTHATIGILAALNRRAATGEGARLDVAMLESAAYWLAYYPHHWWHGGTEPPRTGMRHQYLSPYGPFRAADGKYVSVVVASDADWQRFCDALARADWVTDPAFATVASRSTHRRQLDAIVEEVIAEAPLEHWVERLAQAGLAHGTVRTIAEVVAHPQLIDRGVFVEGDSPVGPLPQIRFPLSETARRDVPGLGEHTDEVLGELGYSAAEIGELRARRVI
jgi:crotonobetainyl-CoA:carnitine CoA-transferase CaiB-like acyl-CoA transferase